MRIDKGEKIFLSGRFRHPRKPVIKLDAFQQKAREEIIDSVEKNIFKFTRVGCRCGSNNDLLLATTDRYGLWVRTVICRNCGLIRTDPQFDLNSLEHFYKSLYRNLYSGGKSIQEEFQLQVQRGQKILKFINSNASHHNQDSFTSRILFEIGTCAGGILVPFKEEGWTVYGCDFDERYLKFGRSQSLNLQHGGMEKLVQLDVKPDIIILSHVLEHISNPDGFLENLKDLFKKNTLLFIEVPGVLNLRNGYANDFLRYLQNAHLYHYSLDTLSTLMVENGFELIIGNEDVRALFRMGSLDDTNSRRDFASLYNGKKSQEISDEIISYLSNLETSKKRLISKILVLRKKCGTLWRAYRK